MKVNLKFYLSRSLLKGGMIVSLLAGGASLYAESVSEPGVLEQAEAQQKKITVRGIVLDDSGEPLIGVTIRDKKVASIGTVTDINGEFLLSVPEGDILLLTSVGYKPQEIRARASGGKMRIIMESDTELLDEVVVVAYGGQKKVSVTGAISSIGTKDLKQSSAANLSVALAGRLPGLTAMQSSGQPGRDDVILYLRGVGTTNSATPLILIDGVPRSGISSIDPNEVESISVLKDASATAVFGVRGANGVILITTRRGKAGKSELNVNANFSWEQFTFRPERIHSWEFAELRNQAEMNRGVSPDQVSFTPYMINKYKSGEDPVFYPDSDPYSMVFKKWAPQQRVNLNMRGGTDKLQYFLNAGYLHQGGIIKTESKSKLGYDPSLKLDRYNFRGNLDYQIAKGLKAFLNLGSYIEKVNSPNPGYANGNMNLMINGILVDVFETPPTSPGPITVAGQGVPEGEIMKSSADTQVWGNINRRGYRVETRTNLNASLGFEWDLGFITKGLSTKLMLSYDAYASSIRDAASNYNVYQAIVKRTEDDPTENGYIGIETNNDPQLSLVKNFTSNYYFNLQYSLNYARTFGKHEVTGLALVQRDNWDTNAPQVPFNVIGFSGRATYGYDQKYLAEVNVGYNGSEQFSPENRFGFFPAFSVGWVASNERFLKDNPVLTHLKLRATYGKVGNDKIGDTRFLYQSNIQMGGGVIPSLGLGQSISQGLLANPDITWETATKQNYGIDLKLFKDFSLSFDYFIEDRKDILIARSSVPAFQGVPIGNIPRVNMGKVENKGYEVEATYSKVINKDFSFIVKGNFAYNKNTQKEMDEPQKSAEYAYRTRKTGYSVGQFFGYVRDFSNGNGYINTEEELASLKYEIGTPSLGDFKYKDMNGDGVINEKDEAPIGYSTVPRITYGASLAVNYKGFDFSVLFQGIGNVSGYYTQGFWETPRQGAYVGFHKKAWTKERYANGEEILYPALGTTQNTNHRLNDFFVMSRAFVRLKNMELGYTLPKNALKVIGIQNARIYVGGQNLFTWDKMRAEVADPELTLATNYPITRMLTVGCNITF